MDTDVLRATADACLLAPHELASNELERVFGTLCRHRLDYADLFFQYSRSEGWSLEEGIVKSGSFAIHQGVGVRAITGDKTALAHSDEISYEALEDAARATRAIARSGSARRTRIVPRQRVPRRYEPIDPLASLQAEDKVRMLEKLERLCRNRDPRIVQVMASLGGEYEVVLIARSDGVVAADVRPLVRLSLQVIAEQDGGGGRTDYAHFTDEVLASYAERAVSQALLNLEAKPAPAGTMTVVLGPGWPGILLHEAIGHGLEGDFNRKGSSAFSGRMGERVAAPGVTVIDDGTLPQRRGSLTVDDEGNPAQCTVLIEDGVLRGYLQDSLNARLMKMPLTGNGRRESFAHPTLPRMTNTYMLAGPHEPEEILASVRRGIYAVSFGGGQVDITNGKFVFSASEAWLIEDGRLKHPIRGATLIGNGPDALTRVSMIGNDLQLDPGIGTCGKDGQTVPVGVGQPTLRIEGLTVGGTG